MIEDIDVDNNGFVDDEYIEIDFESVTFIDLMKMSNNSWSDGAVFDIDLRILKDAVWDTPVKIVQRRLVDVDNHKMYEVWANVEVKSVEYPVPVRVYTHVDEYNKCMFTWKSSLPNQHIDLSSMIKSYEEYLDYKFGDLLS